MKDNHVFQRTSSLSSILTTLSSIFMTILSIVAILSTCYERSGSAQLADEVTYQEAVDTLLEHLCTSGYLTSISIRLQKANACSLSLDNLKGYCDIDKRAIIACGH
jgi:hypothetical protein